MSGEALVCVDPARLVEMWPHVVSLLRRAYATGLGDDTIDGIKSDLDAGAALLWVVWDGSALLAAAVTKIVTAPARKVCILCACGGRELPRWQHFIVELENYARGEMCDLMRIYGRPGWKSVFPDYREPWVALEKELR